MIKDVKIGADPEVFLFDRKKKAFVSAAGHFPGTKKAPHPVENGAIQVDGVALEFNINAASNENEFFKNIKSVFSQMQEMVKNINKDWDIKTIPVATFTLADWKEIPDSAKELGCDPDFSFMGAVNINPTELLKVQDKRTPLRTGSGHIHIGWTEDEDVGNPLHFQDCKYIADRFRRIGISPYHPITNDEMIRMRYYGMNGAFRPKPYGVELRSPSNSWLASEQSIRNAYRSTKHNFDQFTKDSK